MKEERGAVVIILCDEESVRHFELSIPDTVFSIPFIVVSDPFEQIKEKMEERGIFIKEIFKETKKDGKLMKESAKRKIYPETKKSNKIKAKALSRKGRETWKRR